jgi:hypothetical protein
MAQEREYAIPGGSLYYEKTDNEQGESEICITRLQGLAGEVEIPERIEDCPVRHIAKKAFLSKKNLRRVTVPAGVTEVGDWAFAYCDHLYTVAFAGAPRFGRAVFLECSRLRFLYLRDGQESTAALLAAAVTTADAPYLLDAGEAGSGEWLEKWDARMLAILHSPDNEGYSKQVLCGEEDYGSTDLAAYESERRRVKVRLLLLRLLYPAGLDETCRDELEHYLQAHTKGCGQEETWRVVLEEHGEDRAFYQLFAQLGGITSDNFDGLLGDVGEDCPELKAFLMRYKEEKLGYTDFFAGLDL